MAVGREPFPRGGGNPFTSNAPVTSMHARNTQKKSDETNHALSNCNRELLTLIQLSTFKIAGIPLYRQVPRKPRLACPVQCEAYLTRVRGEHH